MSTRGKKNRAVVEEIQQEEIEETHESEEENLDYYQEKFNEIDSVIGGLREEMVTSRDEFNELKSNMENLNATTTKMYSLMREEFSKLKGDNEERHKNSVITPRKQQRIPRRSLRTKEVSKDGESSESSDSEDNLSNISQRVESNLFIAPSIKKLLPRESTSKRLSLDRLEKRENVVVIENTDYKTIKWKRRTLDALLLFFEEVEQYQLLQNQQIKYLFHLLSKDLQEEVIQKTLMRNLRKYKSRADVFKISAEDLLSVTMDMFAPTDTQHFLSLLKNSVQHYEVVQTTRFFNKVRSDLYGLKSKFVERFEFLKDACLLKNQSKIIPTATFKPNGFLNIWMSLTPEKSRESFKMELETKYDSLDEFLEAYFEVVDRVEELSNSAKAYEIKSGWKNLEATQLKKVMVMNETQENEEEPSSECNALSPAKTSQLCHSMLFYNVCDKIECNYQHSPVLIRSEREKLVHLWKSLENPEKQKEEKSIPEENKRRVFPGFKRDTEVRLLRRDPDDDEDEGDKSFINLIAGLFERNIPEDYWKASHMEAEVSVNGDKFKNIGVALFDSGASNDDYISTKAVKELSHWLFVSLTSRGRSTRLTSLS